MNSDHLFCPLYEYKYKLTLCMSDIKSCIFALTKLVFHGIKLKGSYLAIIVFCKMCYIGIFFTYFIFLFFRVSEY